MQIKNYMFEAFQNIPSIKKLTEAIDISSTLKFKIFKLVKTFVESQESKSFIETVEVIKLKYAVKDENGNPAVRETEKGSIIDISDLDSYRREMLELYNMDSGIEIEKIKLTEENIEKFKFSTEDMLSLQWLIDFE